MNEHHYQRIDKGVKRGGKQREVTWKDTEAKGRQIAQKTNLRPISQYSADLRAQAILEAAEGLEIGIRPTEIAKKHGIPQSTLYSWLLDNEVAEQARSRFFHGQLGYALARMEQPEDPKDPLELARWRDIRRAWSEVAAVRDPKNYGMKQEVTHEVGQSFTEALLSIIKARQLRDTGIMSNPNPLITNESPITDADIVADVPQKDPSP